MASRLRCLLPVAGLRRASSGSGGATLSALIERLPVVTPELTEWEVEWREAREALIVSRAKVYDEAFTAAEEGPERTRARLRLEQVVESMGGRQGEGDTTGDESSMDRKLSERVYLALQAEDGSWGLPQQPWAPPTRARDGLQALIAASCGDELEAHQVKVRGRGRGRGRVRVRVRVRVSATVTSPLAAPLSSPGSGEGQG